MRYGAPTITVKFLGLKDEVHDDARQVTALYIYCRERCAFSLKNNLILAKSCKIHDLLSMFWSSNRPVTFDEPRLHQSAIVTWSTMKQHTLFLNTCTCIKRENVLAHFTKNPAVFINPIVIAARMLEGWLNCEKSTPTPEWTWLKEKVIYTKTIRAMVPHAQK